MIDRQHGKVVFQCDGCDDTCYTDEGDFQIALEVMKYEGWKTVRDEDTKEWKHFCKKCAEEL